MPQNAKAWECLFLAVWNFTRCLFPPNKGHLKTKRGNRFATCPRLDNKPIIITFLAMEKVTLLCTLLTRDLSFGSSQIKNFFAFNFLLPLQIKVARRRQTLFNYSVRHFCTTSALSLYHNRSKSNI